MPSTRQPDRDVLLHLIRTVSATRNLDDIFRAALDALADGLNVQRGSILLFDTAGVMRFSAWRGLSSAYRAAVDGHSPWTQDAVNPHPIVVPDVSADPGLAAYLPVIRAEGIESMTFVPLLNNGRLIGKFMLYSSERRSLTSDELSLALIVATHVAFAIERTRALETATRSEARLRFALDAANMGTWDWDLRTNSVRWSENLERIHGLAPQTFDHSFASYEREIHPEDRDRVIAAVRGAIADNTMYDVEYRIVGPDGTIRWVEGKGHVDETMGGEPVHMSGVCMDVTLRKRAEQAQFAALDTSHRLARRIAAIVESSDDVIISKDLQGTITSWNPAAERVFQYSADEVVGRPVTIIIPQERLDEETMVLRRINAGELIEHFETIRRRKDGSLLDVSLTVSPIRDDKGIVVGASKILRDISSRKRNEAELVQLHGRLMTLVTASASLLNSPDLASVRTATIAVARDLVTADAYGLWRIEGATGSLAWRMVTSDGLSEGFAGRIIGASGGAPVQERVPFEQPVPVADVSALPLLTEQLAFYRDEGIRSMLICPMHFEGEATGTLVFYYRSTHAFSELEVQTAQALANIAAAAMTTAQLLDEQRRQREAAESSTRQAGFLAEVGAMLAQSFDYQKTLTTVAQLAVTAIADWCAIDIVDDEGQLRRLALTHAYPVRPECLRALERWYAADLDGRGIHDVIRTGRAALLETMPSGFLDRSVESEEDRAAIRTLDLRSYICVPLLSASRTFGTMTFLLAGPARQYTVNDLRFAQDLASRAALAIENAEAYQRADRANRLKDDFLATLSHELRTPLNAILGYAQMLHNQVIEPEKQPQAIAAVTRNAQSLKQIIDDVLDISRITAGKLRLNMQVIDLANIVTDSVATMMPAAAAKRIRMETTCEPGISAVSGDADRLQQVVWNLLSNAVKFTPTGGTIHVQLKEASGHVQLVVTDNGQGIEPKFLPHLFERFRQADSRFSREHGGLGLGLSIVRELVELHGGRISASSSGAGQGSRFLIELPSHDTASSAVAPDRSQDSIGWQHIKTDLRLDGMRLLAVDDEEDSRELLRIILETAGATVTTARSGADTLTRLQSEPFDALIADLGMPQMDGLALIRHIRQGLPSPASRIPALALTAYARSEDRLTALASGFWVHLAKPVKADELIAAVAAMVRRNP